MLGLFGWKSIVGAVIFAALLAGGIYVRNTIVEAATLRGQVVSDRAERHAAVNAAETSARRAKEAFESERRVTAELADRIEGTDNVQDACLDAPLPRGLLEGTR